MKKIFLIPLILTPIVVISTIALVSSYHKEDSKNEIKKINPEIKSDNANSSLIQIVFAALVPTVAIIILIPIFLHLVKRKKQKLSSDNLKEKTTEEKEETKEYSQKKVEQLITEPTKEETKKIDLNTLENDEFHIDLSAISIDPVLKKSKGLFKFKKSFKSKEKVATLKMKPGKSKEVLEINKFGVKQSFETVLFKKASILVDQTMNLIDNFIMDNSDIKIIKNYKSIITTIDSIENDEKRTLTNGYNMCQEFLKSKNSSNHDFLNKEWLDELNAISSKIVAITENN